MPVFVYSEGYKNFFTKEDFYFEVIYSRDVNLNVFRVTLDIPFGCLV